MSNREPGSQPPPHQPGSFGERPIHNPGPYGQQPFHQPGPFQEQPLKQPGPFQEQPLHRPPPFNEQPGMLSELPAPTGPASNPQGGNNRNMLLFALAVATGVVVVLGGFVLLRSDDGGTDPGEVAPPTVNLTTEPDDRADNSEDADEGPTPTEPTISETTEPSEETEATPNTPPSTEPPPVLLRPVGTGSSSDRPAVARLRCGGSNSFESNLLVDGDLDTGWGAGTGNGVQEWVRIDFGRPVRITMVGMTPGYLRVAPRQDQDCNSVSAYTFNRFVDEVEYLFNEDTVFRQRFDDEPTMQLMSIDETVAESVWIRILSTVPRGDNDTIISEAEFYGYES